MKHNQILRRGLSILLSLVLCLSLLPATALAEGTESVTICGTTLEEGKAYAPNDGGIVEKTEETAYLEYSSGTLTVYGSVTVALPASSTANVLKLESSELTISCPPGSSLTLDGQNSTAAAVSLQSSTLTLTGAGDVTIQGSETAVSGGTLKAERYSGDLAISAAGNSATVNNTVLNLDTTGNISITGSMPVDGGLLTVTNAADVTITGSVGNLLPDGSVITDTGSISIESESNMVVNGLTVNNAEKVTLTGDTNGPVAMSVTLNGCESWDIINKSQTSAAPLAINITVDGTTYGNCYGVTVTADGNGTASASLPVASAGTNITLSATPNRGYRFKEWQVAPDTVTINDNQFTMPGANVTVKAIFEEDAPSTTCDETADFTTDAEAALALLNAAKTDGAANSEWDPATSTLTLKGVDFTTSAGYAVELPAGATIVLAAGTTNTLTSVIEESGDSCGIYVNGNLTIQGSGTLTVTGGKFAQVGCGIYCDDLAISGVTVKATGGDAIANDSYCCGIWANNVTISDAAVVTATGGEATGEESESYGICAYDDMDISGGTVTATGGTAGKYSYGICSYYGGTTISGGTVNATGGTATGEKSDSYGILANTNIKISGGSVTATGSTATDESFGIFAYDTISISDTAEVTATGGNADLYSGGIYADGAVTISGGTVTATGGEVTDEASESFGIESYGSETIIISGGHVTARTLTTTAWTKSALNKAPDLSSYSGYQWRTSSDGDFTNSTDTPYTFDGSHTYVEFDSGAAVTTSVEINAENFPDETFRDYVSDEFDDNSDGVLSDDEIAEANRITCNYREISNLKGIEHFTALTALNCSNNKLTNLDVSSNTALEYLNCSGNQLTELEVGSNTALTTLSCGGNPLTSLNVSKNTALTTLSCTNNSLTKLDVSDLTELTELTCSGNPLTSLDVSQNHKLETLYCSSCALTSLDLSGTNVTGLSAAYNSYDITLTDGTFDLSTLPGKFEVGKASGWNGGSVSGNILTVNADATEVTYTYDCGHNNTETFTLNFFVDVPADAYYYDAVLWAAENGITGGVDDTHFAPNAPCTRAQIVTFLWRAAGSPEPETVSSFADVPADAYYAKAVAWAVENGITAGTGDGMFSPDATCTRAQAMAFIWRSQKSVAADGANPFTDVAADAYYADAVLWAVENGITNGTSGTTFSPNSDCTRAQIVTFLYRCLGEE